MTENISVGKSETERLQQESSGATEFELLGRKWELLPEVFAPFHSPSTTYYTGWLPYPQGGSFLEMGCGAGVTAIHAAFQGCGEITAVDVVASAVENTRRNAVRHQVADRVRAVHSDMFQALGPEERFDLIFWNSNAIDAPADFTYSRDLERSVLDRGFESHRAFLREAPRHLTAEGRLFIGFNSRGDLDLLERHAAEQKLRVEKVNSVEHAFPDRVVEFRLFELIRTGGSA
jgi:methylase of polypeptide subunit release factors